MRKSSKAISLLLSGLMATSCFSMAAVSSSAATVDSESTGVDTLAQRVAAGHQVVTFQFPDSAWGSNAKVKYAKKTHKTNICCNYYAIYGNENEVLTRAWLAPSTNCLKDAETDTLYYFDITESGQGEMEEGADYGVLFATTANAGQADLLQPNSEGYQTCDLYANTTTLNDTYSIDIPAATRENTANSQKIDYLAHSASGIGAPIKKVSTLCAYIDGITPLNTPDSLEIANRLKDYLPNPTNEPSFTWAKIQPLMAPDKFNTNSQEVYDMFVAQYGDKMATATPYEHVDGEDDLKDDGVTLKDCYRYVYTEEQTDTGITVTKYPTLDLVRERLNLPAESGTEQIASVAANISGDVTAGSALPTVSGGDDTYTVASSWQPAPATADYATTYTLTVTFTATEGYEFTSDTAVTLGNEVITNATLNDGVLSFTKEYTTADLTAISTAALTISGDVTPGAALPTVSGGDATFSVASSWQPAPATADYATTYTLTATLTPATGYKFTADTNVTVGGAAFDNVALQSNGTLVATKAYTTAALTPISTVAVSLSDAVVAPGEAVPTPNFIVGGHYGTSAAWSPADSTFAYGTTYTLTATFSADTGYKFTDATTCSLSGVGTGSVDYTANSGMSGDNFVATFTFTMPEEPTTEEPTTEEPTTEEPTTEEPTTEEPAPVDELVVAGTPADIFGTAWDATNTDNAMTAVGDGSFTREYTVTKGYNDVQLKVVANGADWYGDETGNNVTFNLTDAGTFTVTATPDGEGGYVASVSGDIVSLVTNLDVNSVFAVGNGEGAWLNDASWDPGFLSNEMNQVSDGVWEISFEGVGEGFDRQIKFAIDGAWTHNFGGAIDPEVEEWSGVAFDAVYNGDNITFDTEEETQTVKAQLDLRDFNFSTKEGAKFTITIVTDEEPTTAEPTTEEPTTEEPTTEEPTTEEPTTEEPTTEEPTTEEPTTEEPAPSDELVVAGTPADIFGTAWDATNTDNTMTAGANGTFTKEYTVTKAYNDVQLKVVANGADWYGDETGNNVTFNLTDAGTFTVTATPDGEGGYVASVSGDIVSLVTNLDVNSVFAVGNGEGNWLNDASWDPAFISNQMTEVSDGVWEISFEGVGEGFDRQIKFAIDGAWTHNFGGAIDPEVEEWSGVAFDAVYNGDNITFDTEEETQTVKAQLDLTGFNFSTKEGAKFTITIVTDEEPAEAVGVIGDVTGDGQVTIDDATLIQRRGIELETFTAVQEALADTNGDGRVSIFDVTCIQKKLAEYTTGTGNVGKTLYSDGTIK